MTWGAWTTDASLFLTVDGFSAVLGARGPPPPHRRGRTPCPSLPRAPDPVGRVCVVGGVVGAPPVRSEWRPGQPTPSPDAMHICEEGWGPGGKLLGSLVEAAARPVGRRTFEALRAPPAPTAEGERGIEPPDPIVEMPDLTAGHVQGVDWEFLCPLSVERSPRIADLWSSLGRSRRAHVVPPHAVYDCAQPRQEPSDGPGTERLAGAPGEGI